MNRNGFDSLAAPAKAEKEIKSAEGLVKEAIDVFRSISADKKSLAGIASCLQDVLGLLSLASDSLVSALGFLVVPLEPFETERDRLAGIADHQYDSLTNQ